MKDHFNGKQIGYYDTIYGAINCQYFYIHGMWYPDYTLTLMTIYGILDLSGNATKWRVNA